MAMTQTVNGSACVSCVFFDDHVGKSVADDAGLCRYNPPISQPDPNARGLWPVVTAQDWCGHYTTPHRSPAQIAAE